MEEVFKRAQYINPDGSIDVFEGYEVSNLGRVKSYKRGKEKILKLYVCDELGHHQVFLSKNNKSYSRTVHRLVLSTFNPEGYFEKAVVDHIDSNGGNNNLSNLRWFTQKENNSTEHHRRAISETLKGRKLSEETKKRISEAKKGSNSSSAQPCVYDGRTFGCIKDAYWYAREHGYNKCLEKFRQMIKNNV